VRTLAIHLNLPAGISRLASSTQNQSVKLDGTCGGQRSTREHQGSKPGRHCRQLTCSWAHHFPSRWPHAHRLPAAPACISACDNSGCRASTMTRMDATRNGSPTSSSNGCAPGSGGPGQRTGQQRCEEEP
jgi:hypothetical protein